MKSLIFAGMAQPHIGKKIREVLDKSSMSITEFASEINRTRDVAYKIFAKDHIDTGLLNKICKVLNHDFFSYLSSNFLGTKDKEPVYGYATREEVRQLMETVRTLAEEVQRLREILPQPSAQKAKKKARKK